MDDRVDERKETWELVRIPTPRMHDGWEALPQDEKDAWFDWCEKMDWDPIGSGRLAWINQFSTYLRGSDWLLIEMNSRMFALLTDEEKERFEKTGHPSWDDEFHALGDERFMFVMGRKTEGF